MSIPNRRNLGVVLDNHLCCTANTTLVAQSCRFALYNISRIQPILTKGAAQVLVRALVIFRLDFAPLTRLRSSD